MDIYAIITERGLKEQSLWSSETQVATVYDPDVSIEDSLARSVAELQKKTDRSLVVGYDHTCAPIPLQGNFPLATYAQFLLLETIRSTGASFERIIDMGCGNGFLGNFLVKEGSSWQVYYVDESLPSVRSAMSGYGLTMCEDIGMAHSAAKQDGHKFKLEHEGKKFTFSVEPIRAQTLGTEFKNKGIDAMLSVPDYIPGVHRCSNPYFIRGHIARDAKAKFYFTYSSLAQSHVDVAAANLKTRVQKLASIEKPFVIDTAGGPVAYPLSAIQLSELKQSGLIDYGKGAPFRYGHEWRIGLMQW